MKNRRSRIILATEEALRRNELSGASLRRLVGHFSYAFLLRRSSVYNFIDAYPRQIAKLWSSVRCELGWAASLSPEVFAYLRTINCVLATPPCLVTGFADADAQNTRLLKSAVNRKRWRWDVEQASQATTRYCCHRQLCDVQKCTTKPSRLSRLAHGLLGQMDPPREFHAARGARLSNVYVTPPSKIGAQTDR